MSIGKFFEIIVSLPAQGLDKSINTSVSWRRAVASHRHVKRAQEYWHILGPGLTTGASDDDPSGIATYSQTGTQYGFQLLWLAAFTFPLMSIVQEMCARIGLVTGQGLAGNIRENYPRWVLIICTLFLFIANSLNIGADLGAMAKATQLLYPGLHFRWLVLLFAVVSLTLQVFISYKKYASYLKYLALVLLAYIFSTLNIPHLDWGNILNSAIVPSITFSKDQIILICAILGTTISPYLFFWQTSQEIEEEISKGKITIEMRQGAKAQDIKNMRIDVWAGMFLSNLVMFFIITACAATLFTHGVTNINTAAEAAAALKPFAGDKAYLFFALGIIGTGLLAVPVLAGSASYAISESLRWDHGLHRKLKEASAFYGIIIISMAIGFIINLIGFDPIKALIYSAVANGLIAPIILILIIGISSNKKIMNGWSNHPIVTLIGWFVTIIMSISGIAAIVSLFI